MQLCEAADLPRNCMSTGVTCIAPKLLKDPPAGFLSTDAVYMQPPSHKGPTGVSYALHSMKTPLIKTSSHCRF